jgi:hypothetical protein
MSKRHSLFICLVLRFKDRNKSVFFPVASTFHIGQLLSLWRFGGRIRVLYMFRPSVVPETSTQNPGPCTEIIWELLT